MFTHEGLWESLEEEAISCLKLLVLVIGTWGHKGLNLIKWRASLLIIQVCEEINKFH